jgi:dolichol-phosphate mannosyltransferase
MNSERNIQSLDIIVPFYNEGEILMEFYNRLRKIVDEVPLQIQIIFINDGSVDQTQNVLSEIAKVDDRVVAIELSRNFGHQAALTAGLDIAYGDVVITMDGDGQNPPELIHDMLTLFKAGYDIVNTQRINESGLTFLKKRTSNFFYWFINRIGDTQIIPRAADFRLMSQRVVKDIRTMHEYHRFLRGLVAWVGYRTVILPFIPSGRLGGRTKYSLRKMFQLAIDAIFSFSLIPLRIGLGMGCAFLLLAIIEMVYVMNFWFTGRQNLLTPGWSSLLFVILIAGGFIMILLGLIGLYIGYIFQEVKQRPIYIIKNIATSKTNESGEPKGRVR